MRSTPVDETDSDPRRQRSRRRLLDAAASLLQAGGIEAVTVEAVTRVSQVARTTLYRNFGTTTHLIAEAFIRLLPPVARAPQEGTLRGQLIFLLLAQARALWSAPMHLTALGWLAMGPAEQASIGKNRRPSQDAIDSGASNASSSDSSTSSGSALRIASSGNGCGAADATTADSRSTGTATTTGNNELASLRNTMMARYREPFDELLTREAIRGELGDIDLDLSFAQLAGPMLIARLTQLPEHGEFECSRVVDSFLATPRQPKSH